jgi:hypothetical protein
MGNLFGRCILLHESPSSSCSPFLYDPSVSLLSPNRHQCHHVLPYCYGLIFQHFLPKPPPNWLLDSHHFIWLQREPCSRVLWQIHQGLSLKTLPKLLCTSRPFLWLLLEPCQQVLGQIHQPLLSKPGPKLLCTSRLFLWLLLEPHSWVLWQIHQRFLWKPHPKQPHSKPLWPSCQFPWLLLESCHQVLQLIILIINLQELLECWDEVFY